MARLDLRHPDNASGDWYVDERCIDCGTCRDLAPDLFGVTRDQSIVVRQPGPAPDDARPAWMAAQACPTQSIGTASHQRRPGRLFPHEIAPDTGVYDCGYCSPDSFGATAWFARRDTGNILVDSPRFTAALVEPIAELGGIDHVVLTHRDDVADADRWADHFGARVWIHEDDRGAAPYATDLLHGLDEVEISPGLVAVPTPGHTRGSVVFAARQPLPLHRRLAGVEPRARRPHGLPVGLLVLVERAGRLARASGRRPPVRLGPARPRRPRRRRLRPVARPSRRPGRPDASLSDAAGVDRRTSRRRSWPYA